jgi:hypothetical protein
MTYILGSRCADGVVLIADRKFEDKEIGAGYFYGDKLFGEIRNSIIGFSGSRPTFELFRIKLRDAVSDYNLDKSKPPLSKDKFLLMIWRLMSELKSKVREDDLFEALVATGGKNTFANLHYFYADGKPVPIDTCRPIGVKHLGDVLLYNLWSAHLSMNLVAEIGYLIIKYVEKFELQNSVGVGNNEPQIWFIPDHSDEDNELEEDSHLMKKFRYNTLDRLPKIENAIKNLFPEFRIDQV